uniref:protein-serine/threonine phosphatase n=1 Tax=Sander lucioperca TaxID=283035 RepID=A0A8C9Y2L4_SANLU
MSSSVKPARYWNQLLFVVNCTLKCLELIKAHKSLPLLFVYVVCTGWHVYFLRKHKIKSPLLKLIQLSDDKIPHTQYSADVFMMKNKCFCFIHLGNKKTSPPQHQQQYVQLVSFLNSQKMVTNRWCFYVACFVRPMVPNQKTVGLLSSNCMNLITVHLWFSLTLFFLSLSSISESFLTVKGAALFLPRGNGSSPSSASRFSQLRSKHAGDIQQHLQTMFTLLRPEDNIKLAVRLESAHTPITRYMVVVSTNGRQDTEESVVLGMDFSPVDRGFSVSTDSRVHVFKPVSVQAMWSALQSLHKACEVARCHNYFPGSLFLTWVSYYQSRVYSDQARINEWNTMQDVQSHRADSPVLFSDAPTERELTERQIKTSLREIMMQKDLENVTCKEIRTELEMHMTCNLREFKEYIDNEMIVILGQMDSPTEIFDHVFLGSEWNASNLEELQNSGVQYILNVTREIDNFFPGVFEYHNIRVYDEEATDLLAYWNDTYKFISRAKKAGSKCLVHCKMGISRSAATVIAYAMKEHGWDLKKALDYVKERRAVTKPNPSFMRQLEEYQGILLASKQRHNKLWRSHSDSDLSEHHEPLSKSHAQPHSLGRSDAQYQASSTSDPSVKELLDSLGTSTTTGKATHSTSQPDTGIHSNQLCSSYFQGVTGLKPAVHAEPQDPQDQEVRKLKQETEDGDVLSQKEAENVKEEVKNKEEEEAAPARLYSDWTRGSVRRVTRQLEQRMKQEHETVSPSSSPPSLSRSSSGSQRRPPSVHAATLSDPQDASIGLQVSEVSTLQEEQEEDDGKFGPVKRESGDVVEMGSLGNNTGSTKGHKLHSADTRLLSTSSSFHRSVHSPFASVNFLCLEGVTELETSTDWDYSTEGPHGDVIMRETWETLCELGAFLQQVSMDGACKARCVDQVFGLSAGTTRKRGSAGLKRVKEVEARIRQAGLTPPSLMKRSASLAKLGCLELLANDLSEWELSRSSVAPSSAEPPIHTASDESKKQRVHNSPSSAGQQLEVLGTDAERLSDAEETSPGVSPPSSPQRGQLPNSDQESLHLPGLTFTATKQQYGRTHPLRRLKKRTASTLYHTM